MLAAATATRVSRAAGNGCKIREARNSTEAVRLPLNEPAAAAKSRPRPRELMMFWPRPRACDAFPNHLGAENQAGAGVHPAGRISPTRFLIFTQLGICAEWMVDFSVAVLRNCESN